MKFKFKTQSYQTEAVEAIIKVFEGQPIKDRITYIRDLGEVNRKQMDIKDLNISGFENGEVELTDQILLENIRDIQTVNNITLSDELSKPYGNECRCSLDIEMETGTGKTYCYIKTIFALNKKYGWTKFIVVVPSVAIREGVKKSFEQTEEHFFEQYGKKAHYFIYNSNNLNELDNFSSTNNICVMIINSQAFASSLKEGNGNNKIAKIIYSKQDDFASRRPIDVISANRPIIILDEPQKLGGAATKSGIAKFKPLFTLNYSATHKETHNLVYVLDALDAYKKGLVKKIEVKGFELKNLRGAEGYVYLSQIIVEPDKPPKAKIIMEVNRENGIMRTTRIVGQESDLYLLSAAGKCLKLEEYKNGYVVSEINPYKNTITFLNGIKLSVREVIGDSSEKDMRRIQIRETILSHLEKEEKLFNKGIKCLSLFFIDEVSHYRQYDDSGNEILGDYGIMFEQEYLNVINELITLYPSPYIEWLKKIDVHETHKGYFSIDKKTGRSVNSEEKRGVCDDMSAYDLILKNKERLLSFEEPTRFIFSHSALREGWDNPNIFQICTLKQSNSDVNKRQEVGRGMRLCVNQSGERMDSSICGAIVHNINVLTVIASDSYKTFVGDLQRDIKNDLYERPTKATEEYFTGKYIDICGVKRAVTREEAFYIKNYLGFNGYIDYEGNITDKYREAESSATLAPLPSVLNGFNEGVQKLMQGIFDKNVLNDMIKPASEPKILSNALNENFYKDEFQILWRKINHKYSYTVSFDTERLITRSIDKINESLFVTKPKYIRTIGCQDKDNIEFTEGRAKTSALRFYGNSSVRYDLIGKIAEAATIMRKTATAILKGISTEKFAMFADNAEEFISKVSEIINKQKASLVIDTIKYDITDEEPYSSDIFTTDCSNIDFSRVIEAKKHITPYVVIDNSDIERDFAHELELDEDKVCVYAKLPHSFKIPTPIGNYTPDWAIAFYEGSVKYIYFVAETKGTDDTEETRTAERLKISCAQKLFERLENGKVKYGVFDTYQHMLDFMLK